MDLKEAFELLGIPEQVRKVYEIKGMKSLYAWQAECLQATNVLRGESLLYSAPTSGGKTIVAELILLKTIESAAHEVDSERVWRTFRAVENECIPN